MNVDQVAAPDSAEDYEAELVRIEARLTWLATKIQTETDPYRRGVLKEMIASVETDQEIYQRLLSRHREDDAKAALKAEFEAALGEPWIDDEDVDEVTR